MVLPVTLIGGYLGAGKTTLVNHLLRHADGLRLAVLVNEFGALPIDHDLIEAQNENIISIAGGCVCCSYGNDLTLALMELVKLDPPPHHVLLEASGVALPGAIAASISLLPGYTIDGTVIVANAETIREQASDTYIGDTITRQLEHADLLVLNKIDLVSPADHQATVNWLEAQVAGAEIIPARYGTLPPPVVLQSFLAREHNNNQHSHQSGLFQTMSLPIEVPVDAKMLAQRLAESSLRLVRAKGFVTGAKGSLETIQVVGRRWAVSPAPEGAQANLVVIGLASDFDKQAIKTVLEECTRKLV